MVVVVRTPVKRTWSEDPISHQLEHFTFLDDRRGFANVDSLLTRLGAVGSVYVACTESSEERKGGGRGGGKSSDVREMIDRLVEVVESRKDGGSVDEISVTVLPTMSKDKALKNVDGNVAHLLGGDSSEAYLAYRGDNHIKDDPLIRMCLGYFFSADPMHFDGSDDTRGSIRIVRGTLDSHLAMDRTAAEAIHLLPPRTSGAALLQGGNDANNSLYGVLNQCKTKMGSRTLEVWLRQPLTDLESIMRRQNAVAKLFDESIGRDRLREEGLASLRGMDLDKLASRLSAYGRAKANGTPLGSTSKALESLYQVHQLANTCLPPLLEVLEELTGNNEQQDEENDCILSSAYQGLNKKCVELERASDLAERVIDFDEAPRNFLVNSALNPELSDLKTDLDGVQEELEALHSDMNSKWEEIKGKSDQVKLEDVAEKGNTSCVWQFRLADSNAVKVLTTEFQDARVSKILKNGVWFTTKELDDLGSKKKELMEDYQDKQRAIVVNCMSVAATFVPVIERCSVLLAQLDVIASLAHVAAYSSNGYCRPQLTDGEEEGLGIELKEARHPCVELQDGKCSAWVNCLLSHSIKTLWFLVIPNPHIPIVNQT